MATQKKTLRCELVRGKHGVLDLAATLKVCKEALEVQRASEETTEEERATITTALSQFLADNQDKRFKMPAICTVLLGKYLANVPMSPYAAVENKIKAIVRADTDRFWISKGQNGGVNVVDRLNAEEIKAMNAAREKEAKEAQEESSLESAAQ